jgi:virginiamycin A acetyltransferase
VDGSVLIKRACESLAAVLVAPQALAYEVRRRVLGRERSYLGGSERAARWPGMLGELKRRALHRRMGASLGRGVVLRYGCVLKRPPLSIGSYTIIGYHSTVQQARIGRDCIISDAVVIVEGARQHHFDRLDVPIREQGGAYERPVVIGDDCRIGAGAVILADLGDHCVVGAGSVVVHPVEDFKIVAGNPARVLGDRRERRSPVEADAPG